MLLLSSTVHLSTHNPLLPMRTLLLSLTCFFLCVTSAPAASSLAAYGSYWDAKDDGNGIGIRYRQTFAGFVGVEGRGGYVEFDDTDTKAYPLDASVNLRLPFMISPYFGVGLGYLPVSSSVPSFDNETGSFAQLGIEVSIVWIGAMAEVRWHDISGKTGDYLDGNSYQLGVFLKW